MIKQPIKITLVTGNSDKAEHFRYSINKLNANDRFDADVVDLDCKQTSQMLI